MNLSHLCRATVRQTIFPLLMIHAPFELFCEEVVYCTVFPVEKEVPHTIIFIVKKMQNVINAVKGSALSVAEKFTPVLKVSFDVFIWLRSV